MSNLKLGVEVIGAHNLLPRDGNGTSSAFVELLFDGQRDRTSVKEQDLNPFWDETFAFYISDPATLGCLTLEVNVYNHPGKTFLGRVIIPGTSFVPISDAVALHYPLQKKNVMTRVRGELGLRVFVADKVSFKTKVPVSQSTNKSKATESKKGVRHTFHHLPKSGTTPKPSPNTTPNPTPSSNPQPSPNPRPNPSPSFSDDVAEEHHYHKYAGVGVMDRAGPPAAPPQTKLVKVYSEQSAQLAEYALKETSPILGSGRVVGGKVVRRGWYGWGTGENKATAPSSYDLVEKMYFLYVRVVKARELGMAVGELVSGGVDPFVEVRIGNYKGVTRHFEGRRNPEWGQVFAFSKDQLQASVVEVVVKDKNLVARDEIIGVVWFDVNDVPLRVPPDSPLAPEWYRLEDAKKRGGFDHHHEKILRGELMLAVWIGTQADEAFSDAWHSDTATLPPPADSSSSPPLSSSAAAAMVRAKVYHSPRLWYLRLSVIEAHDLVPTEKNRAANVSVRAQLGHQISKTKTRSGGGSGNVVWDEELMFVAAEPFEETLVVSVEDQVSSGKNEELGRVYFPTKAIERWAGERMIRSKWFNLEKPVLVDLDQLKREKFSSRIHVRACLEGGYHVLDQPVHFSSDLRPSARGLWTPPLGVLEMGILRASIPARSAYCVARYADKWVRTRTLAADGPSLALHFNEPYSWQVFDPATVLTLGVFDSDHRQMGKVRIRISTLEAGRIYTNAYPLLLMGPAGLKRMGELHLAVRFSYTSLANMLYAYSKPLLPRMHYLRPIEPARLDLLRHYSVGIVAARLARAEPPLRKEVVEYMSDSHKQLWSMRRTKANFHRLVEVFSGAIAAGKWLGEVRAWTNPTTTLLVHLLFLMLVAFPDLAIPTAFLYMSLIGAWKYRYRPTYPPHANARLSGAESAHPDEMDEEFDTFPTGRTPDVVRMRYDRLRAVGGRVEAALGDLAAQGERVGSLLRWRDPRATAVFVAFCLVVALVAYIVPFQLALALAGIYWLRHPRFRRRLPSVPVNFFRRLPARTDSLL